ncbi:calcineurin-like phosphoesterase superfamily domain protein [Chryseobacterium phage MA9V-1]|nr:calcineurin-like phosphoesterase superfamily domain protein [Chryseobacterium phage MA9V-1]
MSKPTYKADIAKEYIAKFPDSTTAAISRKMYEDYPTYWATPESARSIVRTYRDGLGGKQESVRTEAEKKHAMAHFAIPQTDYKELEVFRIPLEHNRPLLLSDVHVPYHSIEAVEAALAYGEKHEMNAIYLNGDFMDCYGISRFVRDRRLRDMAGELDMVQEFLHTLKERYQLPIYYKLGNHEDRWEIFMRTQAPELLNIPEFRLEEVLHFDEFNVTEVKSKQIAKAGKLNVLHGHEFGHSVFSPVNPARGLYMRAKESSIIGHHHQTSEHSEKSLNDKVVTCYSTGALCGLKPDYMPHNKWNHGFAMVEFDAEGNFSVDNKRIIDGLVR